jgi:hypothetical protein
MGRRTFMRVTKKADSGIKGKNQEMTVLIISAEDDELKTKLSLIWS